MSGILPMTKSEIVRLELAVAELKNKYRISIEEKMMNDGFCMASILNYDNEIIIVEATYGVNIAIPELCFKKNIMIDRNSMEEIDTQSAAFS